MEGKIFTVKWNREFHFLKSLDFPLFDKSPTLAPNVGFQNVYACTRLDSRIQGGNEWIAAHILRLFVLALFGWH